jgi:hypothetical protein
MNLRNEIDKRLYNDGLHGKTVEFKPVNFTRVANK